MKQRKIGSVNLAGVDISRSEVTAPDGVCNKIVNMRYSSGQWSNVCQWSKDAIYDSDSDYQIIHQHPSLDEGHYIAQKDDEIHHVSVDSSGEISSVAMLTEIDNALEVTISHFGSILYVSQPDCKDIVFVWYNGSYEEFDIDAIEPLDEVVIETEIMSADASETDSIPTYTLVAEVECDDNGMAETTTRYDNYHYGLIRSNGYMTGISYLMLGYRLFDGSIIKCSRVYLLHSEVQSDRIYRSLVRVEDGDTYRYYTRLSGGKSTVNFTMPTEILDSPLVSSVVLLATRPQDIYDFENIHSKFDESDMSTLSGHDITYRRTLISEDAKVAVTTPYYVMEEVDALTENQYQSIELDYYTHFESLHYNEVYTPNYSVHQMMCDTRLDYNNRLHCANLEETLYSGYSPLVTDSTITDGQLLYAKSSMSGYKIKIQTKLTVDDTIKVVEKSFDATCCYKISTSGLENDNYYIFLPNILAYPDSRATEMAIYCYEESSGDSYLIERQRLTSAPEVNMSYYVDGGQNSLSFFRPVVISLSSTTTTSTVDNILISPAKVVVSESGNPFSFYPQHTYYLTEGSSITHLATSAQQLTESRYGEHPLIAFTTEGIYAFEQGSGEVLYSSQILISNEVILSGSDLLSVEPFIFYFNSRSIMALSGVTVTDIAKPLHGAASDTDSVDISKYITGAYMLYSSPYQELLVCNNSYDYCYCFSIDTKMWSMRELSGKKLDDSTIASDGSIYNLSLSEDSQSPLACELETLAIKLSGNSYKHLDAISASLSAASDTLWQMDLYGSNNLTTWYRLRSSTMNRYMRRFASSWRYFRVDITVSGYGDSSSLPVRFSISGVDFEFYQRFISHLRGDAS